MSRRALQKWYLVLGIAGILTFPLFAQNSSASLYGAGAPDNAGFVRVFNMGTGEQTVWAGSIQFAGIAAGSVTAYRPVNPGVHAVFVGNDFAELIALDGRFYTVVLSDAGPQVFEDNRHTRADQAQIILYNTTTAGAIELRTADGMTQVIPSVEPGKSGVITVNPVAIELGVASDSQDTINIGDIDLARGQSYGIFLIDSGDGLEVIVRQAEVLSE